MAKQQTPTSKQAVQALLNKYPFIWILLLSEMGVLWRRDYQLAGEDPAILSATTWIFRISTIADAFKALLAQNTVFLAEATKTQIKLSTT